MPNLPEDQQEKTLADGVWSEGVKWEFVSSLLMPAPEVCTAVFCIPTYQGKVVLVEQYKRGWEFPGGHIDAGEDPLTALNREIEEETGSLIIDPRFFGYKKVSPPAPVPLRDGTGFYPFPHSYIPYYTAEVSELAIKPLADDVKRIVVVSADEADKLLQETSFDHHHHTLLQHIVQLGHLSR